MTMQRQPHRASSDVHHVQSVPVPVAQPAACGTQYQEHAETAPHTHQDLEMSPLQSLPTAHADTSSDGGSPPEGDPFQPQYEFNAPDPASEAGSSGDNAPAPHEHGPENEFNASYSSSEAGSSSEDGPDGNDMDQGSTVIGLLQLLEGNYSVPPPNAPLYQELQNDLAQRLLRVKRDRHTFSQDVDGTSIITESNPENLPPDQMCWRHTGDYSVTANLPNSATCREYAYFHLKRWRSGSGVSKSHAEETLRYFAHAYQKGEPNGPGMQNNRHPPSLYACQEILDVPDPETYEYHVCSRGCTHWWSHMNNPAQHLRSCDGCSKCQCPHCHSERYKLLNARSRLRDSQYVEPAQKCWFFYDVFYHMFLSIEWVTAVLNSQQNKQASFHSTPENARLRECLPKHGYDHKKVRTPCIPHADVPLYPCTWNISL
jgi:hypothetical protein